MQTLVEVPTDMSEALRFYALSTFANLYGTDVEQHCNRQNRSGINFKGWYRTLLSYCRMTVAGAAPDSNRTSHLSKCFWNTFDAD